MKEFRPQQNCTIGNVERSPSGRRKILPDGNMDLHKGMKSTGNCIYISKYKTFLFKSF